MRETLAAPDPAEAVALELDEMWSFVLKRANKRWVWIALCRATRRVVAYAVGDRSRATCQKLWAAVPVAYRRGHCFSDFWEAYQLVIPAEQHTAAGKESGLTAHVERWNNTLRKARALVGKACRSPIRHYAELAATLPDDYNIPGLSCDWPLLLDTVATRHRARAS